MKPLHDAWTDFRDAARAFSRPARFYLASEFLAWTGLGIFGVLFNLYLVEAGLPESFVGKAIAMNAVGLALAALPAGMIAERWSRRGTMVIGVSFEAVGHLLRASTVHPPTILAAGVLIGVGQALFQIAAAPFLTEHSTQRERTHLFSMFFASALLAGVLGSAVGGWLPHAFRMLVPHLSLFGAYRASLVVGAALVIPFMNLYFKDRFRCSSAQIGMFFSIAQVFTAAAALLGPALARKFGKLRVAVVSELLSLPFLVTLGAERRLGVAAVSFWLRATLMQAASPLLQTFIMEAMPPTLRARATSLLNLVWNLGWGASAVMAGVVIERFGYAMPFYMTAVLYAIAATTFWLAFRNVPEQGTEVKLSEEAKGNRADGVRSD